MTTIADSSRAGLVAGILIAGAFIGGDMLGALSPLCTNPIAVETARSIRERPEAWTPHRFASLTRSNQPDTTIRTSNIEERFDAVVVTFDASDYRQPTRSAAFSFSCAHRLKRALRGHERYRLLKATEAFEL